MNIDSLYIGTDDYRALIKQGTEHNSKQWFVSVWQMGGMANEPVLIHNQNEGIHYLKRHYAFAKFKF